jgi:tetratricopeptide (TPR) repeat protein
MKFLKQSLLSLGILGTAFLFLTVVAACESGKPTEETKKEDKAPAEAMKEGEPAGGEVKGEAKKEEAMPAGEAKALMAPAGSAGLKENDEGVGHYEKKHWDIAEGHFRKAIKGDGKLAEAHYNLALSLDKLGKHEEATTHFKKSAELAPKNPKIVDSPILKKHTGT